MNVSINMGKSGGEYEPLISSEAETRTPTKGRKKNALGKLPFLCLHC